MHFFRAERKIISKETRARKKTQNLKNTKEATNTRNKRKKKHSALQ